MGIFCGLLFLARESLLNEYDYYQIKQSPAQTIATNREHISSGKGDFQEHRARFVYEVNGIKYDFKSLNTSKKIATAYVTEDQYQQITYAKQAPSKAMLTYHYNLWNKNQNSGGMVYIIVGSIAFISLLLTLPIIALVAFLTNSTRKLSEE